LLLFDPVLVFRSHHKPLLFSGINRRRAGLGKTVQTIALLSALLKKTGTDLDLIEVNRRKKFVDKRLGEFRRAKEEALRNGEILSLDVDLASEVGVPDWSPILIIVPPSVAEHWRRDFATWGHFAVSTYETGGEQEKALESVRYGRSEVLICTKSCFQNDYVCEVLCQINWKLVVVDEFHNFKNKKGKISQNLRALKSAQECLVVGLTGTLMQNDHKELWNLVDLAETNFLGPYELFKAEYEKPIKFAR